MPKHNPTYTEEFDRVLIELVGRLGEAKWAEITRQMKQIYGLDVPQKPMVQARWRAIDPKINREQFDQDEMIIHWHICIYHKCHWDAVRAVYEEYGQIRDKCYLSQKFYSHFQFKLSDLNKIFQRAQSHNQLRIDEMRDTTKKRILEIESKDPKQVFDAAGVEIILSCKIILKLLTYLVDNQRQDFKAITSQLRQFISVQKFQRVLQNIFAIDTIVLISCNELRPTDKDKKILKLQKAKMLKYKKPTQIKQWQQALLRASSPELTEDEEVLKRSFKIRKYSFIGTFTQSDIDEIKQSKIYGICNTDLNQVFYDWYNEAKIQKATVKTDCLVDIVDVLQEDANNVKNKQPIKRTEHLAKKQMKLIEKKKELLMQQTIDDKIKTVRGKIKMDKEVFPGCYTKFFNKEDSECDSIEKYDPDQVYNLALQNNNNGNK